MNISIQGQFFTHGRKWDGYIASSTVECTRKPNNRMSHLRQKFPNKQGTRRNNINELNSNNDPIVNNEGRNQEQIDEPETFYWNNVPGSVYKRNLEEAYEQIVYWRKNVFMMPTGNDGKKFIDEFQGS